MQPLMPVATPFGMLQPYPGMLPHHQQPVYQAAPMPGVSAHHRQDCSPQLGDPMQPLMPVATPFGMLQPYLAMLPHHQQPMYQAGPMPGKLPLRQRRQRSGCMPAAVSASIHQ